MGTQVLPGTTGPAPEARGAGVLPMVQGPAEGRGRRAHNTATLNNNHPHTPYKSDSKTGEETTQFTWLKRPFDKNQHVIPRAEQMTHGRHTHSKVGMRDAPGE